MALAPGPVPDGPVPDGPVPDGRGPVPRFPHHGARIPGTDSGYENGGSLPFFNDSGRPGGLASAPALFRVNNYRKNGMA